MSDSSPPVVVARDRAWITMNEFDGAARYFRALGNPNRLRLLALLRTPRSVRDLVNALELPQPSVSRHLACLQKAGLITMQHSGRHTYCHLVFPLDPSWRNILEAIADRLDDIAAVTPERTH